MEASARITMRSCSAFARAIFSGESVERVHPGEALDDSLQGDPRLGGPAGQGGAGSATLMASTSAVRHGA
jgi:hypothetical protein